ncbi:hypothetical protein PI126_g11025 [Phytophthora idaei]|nr:hypothetical protein PI126_g11025 [Phytophthora idaei]
MAKEPTGSTLRRDPVSTITMRQHRATTKNHRVGLQHLARKARVGKARVGKAEEQRSCRNDPEPTALTLRQIPYESTRTGDSVVSSTDDDWLLGKSGSLTGLDEAWHACWRSDGLGAHPTISNVAFSVVPVSPFVVAYQWST